MLIYYNLETLFDELPFSCGWGYEFWDCDSGVMVGKNGWELIAVVLIIQDTSLCVLAVSWIVEHVSNSGCEVADTVAQTAEGSDTWIFIVHAKMLIIFKWPS